MSLVTNANEFRLEAAEIVYGPTYCRSWQLTADSSSDTNNGYLEVNYVTFTSSGLVEVEGYIWFNVGGAGVDPAPTGKTLIAEAAYAADSDAETRVDAIISALDALGSNPFFYYKKSGTDVLILDNAYPLAQTSESSVSANATLTVLRDGSGRVFGRTKEAITVTSETSSFPIQSNQTGELELDRVIQGTTVQAEAAVLDVSQESKEALIGNGVGDIVDLGGGINAVGLGESKLFQNQSDIGGRVIFHPIRLDRSDRSADFVMWNSLPLLTEYNFDGTDTQAIGVQFNATLAQEIKSEINLCVFGEEWMDNDVLA